MITTRPPINQGKLSRKNPITAPAAMSASTTKIALPLPLLLDLLDAIAKDLLKFLYFFL